MNSAKHPRNQLKERIAPGIWVDMENGLHISIEELLEHFNLADTPENRAQLEKEAVETVKQLWPETDIVYRPYPDLEP